MAAPGSGEKEFHFRRLTAERKPSFIFTSHTFTHLHFQGNGRFQFRGSRWTKGSGRSFSSRLLSQGTFSQRPEKQFAVVVLLLRGSRSHSGQRRSQREDKGRRGGLLWPRLSRRSGSRAAGRWTRPLGFALPSAGTQTTAPQPQRANIPSWSVMLFPPLQSSVQAL